MEPIRFLCLKPLKRVARRIFVHVAPYLSNVPQGKTQANVTWPPRELRLHPSERAEAYKLADAVERDLGGGDGGDVHVVTFEQQRHDPAPALHKTLLRADLDLVQVLHRPRPVVGPTPSRTVHGDFGPKKASDHKV